MRSSFSRNSGGKKEGVSAGCGKESAVMERVEELEERKGSCDVGGEVGLYLQTESY